MKKKMAMDNSSDPSEITKQISKQKGGLKTMPFIIVNESFEKVASYGLQANMILYLTKQYNLPIVSATILLSIWSATSSFITVIGAFLGDSYLGRFKTITTGSITSFLGMLLLWFSAEFQQTRPPTCNSSHGSCKSPNAKQMTLLFSSFVLMSIGAGCVRPCSLAFGADQLERSTIDKQKTLQRYFGWYYISVMLSVVIAVTGIVYIQENRGWGWGFGVPLMAMFLATLMFLLGSCLYIKRKPDARVFTGLAMAIVAAVRKRHHALPPKSMDRWYHHKGSRFNSPTEKLRFLNKACMITDPEKDLNSDGSPSNPWKLCTVEQVEALKALLRLIPICSTGIVLNITTISQPFGVLQANSMNRHLGNFQIPAGSFSLFLILAMTLWVVMYDQIIQPIFRKRTGKQQALGVKQRMGIGLFFSFAMAVVAAFIERDRRRMAIRHGLAENIQGVVPMSAMWLVPQQFLAGLGEAFNAIAQTEFYYSQLPKSMTSIVMALFTLTMAIGSLLSSLLLQIVNGVTKRGGKESWVSNNLNKGHYDYYFWLLAVLNLINFGYFAVCCWSYGPVEVGTWEVEEKKEEDVVIETKSKELEMNNV